MLQKKIARSILGMAALAVMLWVGPGIKAEAFDDNTYTDDQGIMYTLDDDNATASVSNGKSATGLVIIPASIDNNGKIYSVETISSQAFYNGMNPNELITSVTIPETVTYISGSAFEYCINLENVIISGDCVIDPAVFRYCSKLKNVTMNKVNYLGILAFGDCTSLESVTILDAIDNIPQIIFMNCDNLKSIVVTSPDMKTKMEDYKSRFSLTADIILKLPAEGPRPSTSKPSAKAISAYVPPAWVPTPDHIYRASFIGKSAPTYTLSQVDYGFRLENTMQGPLCFDVFNSARGEYTIGRTYSAYMNDTLVSDLPEAVTVTMKIPEELQKENCDFIMICEHHGGQSTILKDLDESPETITFTVKECYAFALCYMD